MAQGKWSGRLGRTALVFAVAAWIVAILGASAARFDLIGKLAGFQGVVLGVALSLVALVLGLVIVLTGWLRRRGTQRKAMWGALVALAFFALIASYVVPALGYPALHDATTDLDDPPTFAALTLPDDNLRGVDKVANWQAMHRQAYPDLQTVRIDRPVADVVAKAERLARDRGWTIARADPAAGELEATAYASYLRFNDYVVLRARPVAGGSEVDMRSTSEVGVGDLGYNANRVRRFLEDLRAD